MSWCPDAQEIEEMYDDELDAFIAWYEKEVAAGHPFNQWERISYLDALKEKTSRE